MSTEVAERPIADIVDDVVARGDLSKLTSEQRVVHYHRVCESLGLNPATQPFQYITLNGKLQLYARKDATDQLRKVNGISIEVVGYEVKGGLLTVHVSATDKTGRKDEDFGVVSVANLSGEAASNAFMKAVTKGKRRVTLSLSGLGFSDESEIESIPAFSNVDKQGSSPPLTKDSLPPSKITAPPPKAEPVPYRIERREGEEWGAWANTIVAAVRAVPDVETIEKIFAANVDTLQRLETADYAKYSKLYDIIENEKAKLNEAGT